MIGSEGDDGSDTIRLVEETASVSKERNLTGQVRVSTATDTFDEVVHAELRRDGAIVTRVPINVEVKTIPNIRTEGDVTIVPVLEEILVVEKRLYLKEEIHIKRTSETDDFHSHVTLRRQRAIVERLNEAGETIQSDPSTEQSE